MFIMGPMHPEITTPGASGTEPEPAAKQQVSCLYALEGMKFGAVVPVHPFRKPGGPKIEPKF